MFDKFLISENVGIKLYGVMYLKEEIDFTIKKINLLEDTKEKLKDRVLENTSIKKEYQIKRLEEYNDEKEVLCEIVEEHQSKKIEKLLSNIELDISESYEGDFSDIYGVLYKVVHVDGDILWIYKQNYSVNVISDKIFSMVLENSGFFKFLNKTIFKLNAESDFFIFKITEDGCEKFNIYVDNLNVIERNFGMQDVIKKKALENIDEIDNLKLIQSVEVLKDKVRAEDMTFTRKLMRLNKESPVFKLKKEHVFAFIKKNKITKNTLKIITNDGIESILISSEKEKNMFLKLLNDDILHSELTNMSYISNSKDVGENIVE